MSNAHDEALDLLGKLNSSATHGVRAVLIEYEQASRSWAPFNSAHEGWAVIREEVDELWAEVKNDKRTQLERLDAMRDEAIQVAAMALRFIEDVTW